MTLSEKIVEAEAALHALVTGTSVVELVDQNGERIRYTAASRSALQAYIDDLKRQNGTGGGGRAARVWM